ncbi:MAG: sulfate adenylyltransferase subunit CysN [Campylobacterales bacterium]|nr:sulfate adenylyltransferase subunit CysN [Campylobacterales bacterium]
MAHQSELIAENIEAYLKSHEHKELLRFITCGSVDDGKSTLIGRLLYDSKMIFEDQLASIEKDSKKMGTTGGGLDLALLVDGLQSEREQGITIDVAYRFFSTERRKFIIADTPGHEQYTRNMATGASSADLAIILIDARYGVATQTRRHAYITALLGIKRIMVAVNKMDLVGCSQERFETICRDFEAIIPDLPHHEQITFGFIPISALEGDNVVTQSERMAWYKGDTLMHYLDTVALHVSQIEGAFRFPVQYVNRPHLDFRGFCGTIASGSVKVGDAITVLPSGKTATVKSIIAPSIPGCDNDALPEAFAPMAVTLTTNEEVDISRGDMIVHSAQLPRVSNSLKVMVVWMDDAPMTPGNHYLFKTATTLVSGSFAHINYRVDVNSYQRLEAEQLALNDIASCKLVLSRPIAADAYHVNRSTGSFIVIDRITNRTVGAGMIQDVSRRDSDTVAQHHRSYSEAEIALNAYIRAHFPEWGCKVIG